MSPITQAASVLLARDPGSSEVYLVSRSPRLRFMGGMVAFPGGKIDQADEELASPDVGLTARHVGAIRELFEETGILLARNSDGTFPPSCTALAEKRRWVLEGKGSFAGLLRSEGWHLSPQDLTFAGHLVTPPFSPIRFDTAFFVATRPEHQQPEIWPGELSEGWWTSTTGAIESWRQGKVLLTPPTVSLLETLEGSPVESLPSRLRPMLEELEAGLVPPIYFCPNIRMIPLDCQGLSPTTHTNTLLVGRGPRYLIDPGPADPGEQAKLFAIVDRTPPDAILLSHHHRDHVAAANLASQRYGVPIWAHPETSQLLSGKIAVDRMIGDGEELDLGPAPHGHGRWSLRALHTPGHAPGHLTFYQPDYQILLAGDMVSPLTSMIISPEDGDLAQYVNSLRRLAQLPMRLLLPAHGGATANGKSLLEDAIAHRLTREKQILDAIQERPLTVAELTHRLYRGFPESVLKLARLQIHAGLIKLEREGQVTKVDDSRWRWSGA